jgi:hypothetical protein
MRKSAKYLFYSISILFFCFSTEIKAENFNTGLRIDEVFQRYARARNVTMVELSQEMLEMYNMKHYRSIAIKNNPEALKFIRECLEIDQRGARKIKEVTDENGIISAYYQLAATNEGLNRFILFNVNKQNLITLVYIEGDLDSDDLITLLFSL